MVVDTSENIEYFGDPDLVQYSPYVESWDEPVIGDLEGNIDGHSLLKTTKHPSPSATPGFEAFLMILVISMLIFLRKRK